MPRYFLTRLTIEGFRGINNENDPLDLQFDPNSVNSIFAVNGTGKTSIFEALCFAIHGTIPKLQLLQAQERPQDYFCNRFHSKQSASITLQFQPDDGAPPLSIRIDRDALGSRTVTSPSGHPDPETFLSTLKEAFALLDYRTFSRFIEESPLERGRTFSALLGLADYSECRQALQAASDSRALNTDLEIKVLATAISAAQKAAQQALVTLTSSYERVTGKPLKDVDRLDECADAVTAALGGVELLKTHILEKGLHDVDFGEVKAAIRSAETGEKRRELEKTIESIVELEALAAYDLATVAIEQHDIGVLIDDRDRLLALTRGDIFKRLYECASDVISNGGWAEDEKCPLCESDLGSNLSEHVVEQLAQYADAALTTSEIKDTWQASAWKKCLSAHEEAAPLDVAPDTRQLPMLDANITSGDISKGNLADAATWTTTLTERVASALEAAQARREALERELPASLVHLTEQVEYGLQFKVALERYRESQLEEAVHQARLDIRERWKAFILNATATFSGSEEAISRARIQSIDAEYKSMFREIMQVGDVVPDLLRADDREDLHVQLSDFHGQHRLSARALLSESYRNALAISIFLAAAQVHSGAPRFVVLDDVTSSFDAGHQFFLMELIRRRLQQPQNINGLQFIILSHDGLLEKYFDRHGGTSNWRHNKLQGSPPLGAIFHQAQGAERLKTTVESLLSAGQGSQAEPLIRQYLEYKLQQVIRKVDIPVPLDFAIKDTSRMVSNCLDAIGSAVELHKKAGSLVLESQQVQDLDTSHVPAIVGNWVSHYETGSGSSLSVHALRGVIRSIDALAECFRYDDASGGSTARKWYKSLSRR
ncbi:recombination protein F [Planctomycetes bacterium Pla163]|uniref:Recombination protein F n=1 Tax=Rohdeia mirabilis TaxID=2528008 RepID=A0A518D3W9_9BACT|nr:recombination protein F [Planctomycetes bacterium Pla163]